MRAGVPVLVALALLGCVSSPDSPRPEAPGEPIMVSGRVTVTGSAPLVTLVIVAGDQHYALVGRLAEELWDLQQRSVTVRGRIVQPADGPGFPAQIEVDEYTMTPPR